MKAWRTALVPLVLTACAGTVGVPDLQPGKSTTQDVARQMGKPALTLDQPGGGKVEYFTSFPFGRTTYAVSLGTDGVVRSVDQRLTQDNMQKIAVGMKKSQVLELLGPPREETADTRMQRVTLEYPWMTGNSRKRITWVHVSRDGVVQEVVEREDFEAEPSE